MLVRPLQELLRLYPSVPAFRLSPLPDEPRGMARDPLHRLRLPGVPFRRRARDSAVAGQAAGPCRVQGGDLQTAGRALAADLRPGDLLQPPVLSVLARSARGRGPAANRDLLLRLFRDLPAPRPASPDRRPGSQPRRLLGPAGLGARPRFRGGQLHVRGQPGGLGRPPVAAGQAADGAGRLGLRGHPLDAGRHRQLPGRHDRHRMAAPFEERPAAQGLRDAARRPGPASASGTRGPCGFP